MSSRVSPHQPGRRHRLVPGAGWVFALLAAVGAIATPRAAARAAAPPPPQDTTRSARVRAAQAAVQRRQSNGAKAAQVVATPPRAGPRMPRLVGLDTAAAIDTLRRMDVSHRLILPPGGALVPLDSIAAQAPAPGAALRLADDTVVLTLAGRAPASAADDAVPDGAAKNLGPAATAPDKLQEPPRHSRPPPRTPPRPPPTGRMPVLTPALLLLLLLVLAAATAAAARAVRAARPPPTIAARAHLHTYAPRLTRGDEPFVGASVSLRSRIVHHHPRLRADGPLVS